MEKPDCEVGEPERQGLVVTGGRVRAVTFCSDLVFFCFGWGTLLPPHPIFNLELS